MKITVIAASVVLLAGAFYQPAHAQVQVTLPGVSIGQPAPQPGYGPGPPPNGQYADQRERCDRLESRSHELHESMDRTPPGPERVGLEQRLQQTHQEMEQCHGR